jgi:hypothetical protein
MAELTADELEELEYLELLELEAADSPAPAAVPENSPVSPVAELPPAREPNVFKRALGTATQGVSDAMSTVAGDSFGLNAEGDPTQRDDLNPIERGVLATGRDFLGGVGEAGGDIMMETGKALLPPAAEEAIASGAQYLANTDTAQAAGRGLQQARESLGPKNSALAGAGLNIAASLLPVPKIKPKFGINSRNKLDTSVRNRKIRETERLLEPDNLKGKGDVIENTGLWQSREYKPVASEQRVAERVAAIPDSNPRKSNNYNRGVVKKEIDKLDKELIGSLDGLPAVNLETVTDSIDDALDRARQLPNLSGDAGEVATTLANQVDDILLRHLDTDGNITPDSLLKVRRELDQWTKKYGPKDLYSDKGSALNDANREVREGLNSVLSANAPDGVVREKLSHMSDLLDAEGTLFPRSLPAREKGNRFSRYIQDLERSLGFRHPTTPQAGVETVRNPLVAAAVGTGALGLGTARNLGAGVARNRTAATEALATAIRSGQTTAQKAAIIAAMQDEEEEY